MAFRIRGKESVEESVRRIACEQIDKAIGEIGDDLLDRHEAVHQVRKRCKKVRALIRLVRPQLGDTYDLENDWYRDSAGLLSYVRDAQSIIETHDKLVDRFDDQIDREAFSSIRRQLTARRRRVAEDEVGLDKRLEEFLARMHEARRRVAAWRLPDDGFAAVQGGLAKTYGRGRRAMKAAYGNPTGESFHEWRKRAKYHWYHMRLLRPVWKGPLKARRDETHLLADYLGDDHDLSILLETLLAAPSEFGGESTTEAAVGLIRQRQVELRTLARPLGQRLFAEKSRRFVRRMNRYWQAWQAAVKPTERAVLRCELTAD